MNDETEIHLNDTTLRQDLERLAEMKAAERHAESVFDSLKREREVFEQSLFDRMDIEDTWSLRGSAHKFSAKSTTFATVTDLDALRAWAIEQGVDDEFLVEKPQKGRLNELVREYLDNGQTLPPGLSSYDRRYISVTKIDKDN